MTAYNHLSGDWMLYKAENGKLVPWQEGEFLKTTNGYWQGLAGGGEEDETPIETAKKVYRDNNHILNERPFRHG
ncbi:hypothetical protein [Lysinibacillus xylanilyticus]|uniref:hypothetical protein n=1 Tax=Lysinibacillus xylanilyticus TaxID=582475 RepID=UPI003D03C93D